MKYFAKEEIEVMTNETLVNELVRISGGDIAEYCGIFHYSLNKTMLIKCLIVSMGNTLSSKHFSNLKLK